jgi:hypothetical protein
MNFKSDSEQKPGVDLRHGTSLMIAAWPIVML